MLAADTAVLVAIRLPGGVARLKLAASAAAGQGTLDRLFGLDPARHLGWLGDEAFLALADFAPPGQLVPGAVLGGTAPDPVAASAALADLEHNVSAAWGVSFIDRETPRGAMRVTALPWLVGCQPAWSVRDGFGLIAFEGRSLVTLAPEPPPADLAALSGTLLVYVDGPRLRALNDHLTEVDSGGTVRREPSPLERRLERLVLTLAPAAGGLAGRLRLDLESP
jgi:hypothetical protein